MIRRGRRVALVVVSLSCARPSIVAAQTPTQLGVAGRSNESVSIAADGRFAVAVWGATAPTGTDVYCAVSRDAGEHFGAPVRVNATPFDARVGGEQPPHVVLVSRRGAEPAIVVVWTAKRKEGSRLLTARSENGGAAFGATSVVPGSDAAGNRGWESVAADAGGRVHVLWLDHRGLAMPSTSTGAVAAGGPAASTQDPVQRASLSQLFVASLDGSTPPQAITGGVCYCCKTAITTGADGTLYAAWRHVYPGDLRDIAFTTSRTRGASFAAPVRVSEDHWEYDGCPDNGPAVAVGADRRIHVVWPSPADVANAGVMAIYYATSSDAARFSPRVRIPTDGPAGHVQVLAASDGGVLVAWEEMTAQGRVVKLARGSADRGARVSFRAIGSAQPGRYPALATTTDGVMMAWTQGTGAGSTIAVTRMNR